MIDQHLVMKACQEEGDARTAAIAPRFSNIS